MGRPDKQIVGTEQFSSCGGIDKLLSSVPASACESVLREINEAPVDFREYCECSDYTFGPNFCSLCGDGTLIDDAVNQSQLLLGGYTCGEYHDLAGSAQTLEYCSTLRMAQPVCCETTRDSGNACHVCDSGADMQVPNRRITLLADNVTCETYDRELQAYAENPYCDGLPGFNFASYCHCSGAKAPKSCGFCAGTDVMNPDLEVYIDGLDVWLTCEELSLASLHVSDDHLCSLLNVHSYACCGVDASAFQELTCQICPENVSMALPSRPIAAHFDSEGNAFTCESFDQYLQSQSSESCRAALDDDPVDLASYCGCDGSPTFPNVCQPMCPEGKVVEDPDRDIQLAEANVTCGQADLLNTFFTDVRLCADNFPVLEATCCVDAPATTGFGSQSREYKKYQQYIGDLVDSRIGSGSLTDELEGSTNSLHYANDYGSKGSSPTDAEDDSATSSARGSRGGLLVIAWAVTLAVLLRI